MRFPVFERRLTAVAVLTVDRQLTAGSAGTVRGPAALVCAFAPGDSAGNAILGSNLRFTIRQNDDRAIPAPRMRLAELSPMTQRKASTRLDLPQPLGPTIPVKPSPICRSVGSTNDLKP